MDSEVKEAVKILEKKDAEEITVLDIREVSNLSSYFVIATANSEPHMMALRDALVEELDKNNIPVIYYDRGKGYDWLVVDCGYFIVHVFSKKGRQFYALEDLWLHGKKYGSAEVLKV